MAATAAMVAMHQQFTVTTVPLRNRVTSSDEFTAGIGGPEGIASEGGSATAAGNADSNTQGTPGTDGTDGTPGNEGTVNR